jgi:hypothetical protein
MPPVGFEPTIPVFRKVYIDKRKSKNILALKLKKLVSSERSFVQF